MDLRIRLDGIAGNMMILMVFSALFFENMTAISGEMDLIFILVIGFISSIIS